MGGYVAIEKILAIKDKLFGPVAESTATLSANAMLHQAHAVRSAFYSFLTYGLTQIGTIWAVIILQSILAVWLITVARRLYGTDRQASALRDALILALCTSLPWSVSYIMPDIFTSFMILTLGCLVVSWSRLPPVTRLGLLVLFGASVVMHVSNLPLALVLIMAGAALRWRTLRTNPMRWLATGGMLAAAVAGMLLVSYIGFGEWSLTPKGAPFLTARSISDGPGRLYLLRHCPQAGLAMCRHLDRLDLPSDDFIWGGNGVYSTVSPDEQAELRHEDKQLYLHAAEEQPWLQMTALASNTVRQLTSISVLDMAFPSAALITPDSFTVIDTSSPTLTTYSVSVLNYLAVITACLALRWLWATHRLTPEGKQLVTLIGFAVVMNAMIAGGLSMPAPRYEARVIWLLPFLAFVLWRKRQPAQQAPGDAL